MAEPSRPVIIATPRAGVFLAGLSARINNCTVPKFGMPAGAPWIILASDEKGRVYEADLSKFSF